MLSENSQRLVMACILMSREGKTDAYADNQNVSNYLADLSDTEQAGQFVAEAITNAGRIEAGILLAGGFAMAKLTDTSDADIEQMLTMNFRTAFHVVKPLMKHFEATGGGQFIFIGARARRSCLRRAREASRTHSPRASSFKWPTSSMRKENRRTLPPR